ncbi:glycine zipper 2TM domain-containing protein [Sphingomonas sp. QA11]|nr:MULTISPECIES: glycine zipper 2TM domain-containing protein [unclassified Sphingomonas]WCM30013.1 glycine zipper 2TM domain-containing protein [Sphingomonas sp. QA11]WEK02565.1 MAG: glycine zipper 2TM domain-containing protein [Sphingomonas sp.]
MRNNDRGGYPNGRDGYQNGRDGYQNGRDGYGGQVVTREDDRRFATDYDASRDYRDDPRYTERRLSSNDQVYRGSDGRYYCKRNDGTTGLIVGAIGGGILGNIIDGGHNRAAGTLIGGALGALAGKSIDQKNSDVRCR